MSSVRYSVFVNATADAAYAEWTRFEDVPRFLKGVEGVRRISPTRLRWAAQIGGVAREWDAEIVDQIPGRLIAWRTVGNGPRHSGTVTFTPIGADAAAVTLHLEFRPEGVMETAASVLGIVRVRIKEDLERFKMFLERRDSERSRSRAPMWRSRSQTA